LCISFWETAGRFAASAASVAVGHYRGDLTNGRIKYVKPYVEGTVAELFDGRDPGKRQEEAEMIREVGVSAGDRLAARQVLSL
jgi:hypothetical protein